MLCVRGNVHVQVSIASLALGLHIITMHDAGACMSPAFTLGTCIQGQLLQAEVCQLGSASLNYIFTMLLQRVQCRYILDDDDDALRYTATCLLNDVSHIM